MVAAEKSKNNNNKVKQTTARSFMFNRSAIAALKARGTQKDKIVPSRAAAVTALLWKCLLSALYEEKKTSKEVMSVIVQAVNLRSRIAPPLPNVSFGNISKVVLAAWPVGNKRIIPDDDHLYQMLVKELKHSTGIVDDAYARTRNDTDMGYLGVPVHEPFTKIFKDNSEKHLCSVSSWLTFPAYQINFGWGNPVWVATSKSTGSVIILVNKSIDDNEDNNGIEALVCLEEEVIHSFLKNPELLAFCSGTTNHKTSSRKFTSLL